MAAVKQSLLPKSEPVGFQAVLEPAASEMLDVCSRWAVCGVNLYKRMSGIVHTYIHTATYVCIDIIMREEREREREIEKERERGMER